MTNPTTHTLDWPTARAELNRLGERREPCLLLLDFELRRPLVLPLLQVNATGISYDFHGRTNARRQRQATKPLDWHMRPVTPERYQEAFARVQQGLQRGDSFLTNLTFPTDVTTSWSLSDIFHATQARYRLHLPNRFVCFSPEIFVQVRDNRIYSFPMKGTAPLTPGADAALLADPKEQAEHATIVDLIRNDLSRVARRVRVERYRYLEAISTARGGLWQTSSRIGGELPADWPARLGDLFEQLLPAGSVSGAPKLKTLEIIREAEGRERGYYCGVASLFTGYSLDSCVLIRFVEQYAHGLRYWSGGGITAQSRWEEEYAELLEKVYLPVAASLMVQR